jgi:hypothetical protein
MENDRSEIEISGDPVLEVNHSPESNLPFAITLAALLIYFSVQALQLVAQRSELSAVKASQESALQASQKVQEQFKTVMTKLDELAKQGHAGAKMVLDDLQNAGDPPGKPGQ